MLKRLYVHNYKCLVNFEINFDQDVSLFLGANGAGKSTIFEVLDKLRRLTINEEKIENLFSIVDIPRWLVSDIEKSGFENIIFEMDFQIGDHLYKYNISIGIKDYLTFFIQEESLSCNNEKIIESKNGTVHLFKEKDLNLPFNNSRSSISHYLSNSPFLYHHTLLIARINPYQMSSTINNYNSGVMINFSNFAEWFAYLQETNRRAILNFEKEIREILPNYEIFNIQLAGQAKTLQFEFKNKHGKFAQYYLHELSEGQKVLIALYTLIFCSPENSIICIDEPENFLALPEIQPWLNAMRDQCSERNLQVILISHHPSLINFLATSSGYWFSRQDNHTRIEKITKQDDDGLSLAQLIEMGWIYGD